MNIQQYTLGEIVAKDARAAEIFERHAIDFCCNGHKTLGEACMDTERYGTLAAELQELLARPVSSDEPVPDHRNWPLDRLADHIETEFHRETTRRIGIIQGYLEKLLREHGKTHPELFAVQKLFAESAAELSVHMKREELILFPFIRKMVRTGRTPAAAFGRVGNPIRVLTHDHEEEGERFRKIAGLTDDYTVPDDGCTTYRLTFQHLKEFESMLHFHIHLENNVLFPGALEMAGEDR